MTEPEDNKISEPTEENVTPSADKKSSENRRIVLRLDVKDPVRERSESIKLRQEQDGAALGIEDMPPILYEDNHLLVVVKPQNIPTQGDDSGDRDLLNILKEYLVKKYDKPGDAYLGLLHRLDRPTGGVMVFAKTSKAASRLSEQIRNGEFEKTYTAIVSGQPKRTGVVEHYLVKDEKSNTVTVAPSTLEGAKRAASDIKLIDSSKGISLVTVKLLTGRTHQARVQLKALGSPIAGDRKYATGDKYIKCNHLALWAYKLVFAHPTTGDLMTFLSEPPDEYPWTVFDTESLVAVDRPIERGYNLNKKK